MLDFRASTTSSIVCTVIRGWPGHHAWPGCGAVAAQRLLPCGTSPGRGAWPSAIWAASGSWPCGAFAGQGPLPCDTSWRLAFCPLGCQRIVNADGSGITYRKANTGVLAARVPTVHSFRSLTLFAHSRTGPRLHKATCYSRAHKARHSGLEPKSKINSSFRHAKS